MSFASVGFAAATPSLCFPCRFVVLFLPKGALLRFHVIFCFSLYIKSFVDELQYALRQYSAMTQHKMALFENQFGYVILCTQMSGVFSMHLCPVFCIAFTGGVAFRSPFRSLCRRPNSSVSFLVFQYLQF